LRSSKGKAGPGGKGGPLVLGEEQKRRGLEENSKETCVTQKEKNGWASSSDAGNGLGGHGR